MSSRLNPPPHPQWDEEELIADGDAYFQRIGAAIDSAQHTVWVETYILADDPIGRDLLAAMSRAHLRGLDVRLNVDGVGSWSWVRRQLRPHSQDFPFVRVYHPVLVGLLHLSRWSRRLNRRLHRKIVAIDGQELFVGSFNFTQVHSRRFTGSHAWQDMAVRVRGSAVAEVLELMTISWNKSLPWGLRRTGYWVQRRVQQIRGRSPASGLIRSNHSFTRRRQWHRDLIQRLRSARERIWIGTPYFLPERRVLGALLRAPGWRRPTQILTPEQNDIAVVRWATLSLAGHVLKRGLRWSLYRPRFFHGKVMVVDDWITVGSTNFNHRSFLHDLELDVVLTHSESKQKIAEIWHQWNREALPLQLEDLRQRSWTERALGQLFYWLRWWL